MLVVFDNVASVVTSIAIIVCKFHESDMQNINTNLHYTKKKGLRSMNGVSILYCGMNLD
jgi:hypothetical protein